MKTEDKNDKIPKIAWIIVGAALIIPSIMAAVQSGIAVEDIAKFIGNDLFYNVSAWAMVVVTIAMAAMNYTSIKEMRSQAEDNRRSSFWKLRYDTYIECKEYFDKVESELEGKYKGTLQRICEKEKFDKLSKKIGFLFGEEEERMMNDIFSKIYTWASAAWEKKRCYEKTDEYSFMTARCDEAEKAKEHYKIASKDHQEAGMRFTEATEELYAKLIEKLMVQ